MPVGFDDSAYEVADSTDWLDTGLSSFASVEAGLRCHVCKDFYTTPMITACSHTFCSLCIRRCLATDGKCPECRTSGQENQLRSNWTIEQVVEAFQRARPSALEFARRKTGSESKKRKRTTGEVDGSSQEGFTKRTRSSSRIASKSQTPNVAPTSDYNEEVEISKEEDDDTSYEPEDGLVACPICNSRMKLEMINPHLDRCTGEPAVDESPTSAVKLKPANEAEGRRSSRPTNNLVPLATLSYSLLKDQALRKKLAELGLSTIGTKQQLEARHREWVTLWNANCDAAHPRRKHDLLQDLEIWERTQGSRAPASRTTVANSSQIKSKDFDSQGWQTKHSDSFRDLIISARRNAKPVPSSDDDKPASRNSPSAKRQHDETNSVSADDRRVPVRRPAEVASSDTTDDSDLDLGSDRQDHEDVLADRAGSDTVLHTTDSTTAARVSSRDNAIQKKSPFFDEPGGKVVTSHFVSS